MNKIDKSSPIKLHAWPGCLKVSEYCPVFGPVCARTPTETTGFGILATAYLTRVRVVDGEKVERLEPMSREMRSHFDLACYEAGHTDLERRRLLAFDGEWVARLVPERETEVSTELLHASVAEGLLGVEAEHPEFGPSVLVLLGNGVALHVPGTNGSRPNEAEQRFGATSTFHFHLRFVRVAVMDGEEVKKLCWGGSRPVGELDHPIRPLWDPDKFVTEGICRAIADKKYPLMRIPWHDGHWVPVLQSYSHGSAP